MSLSEALEVEYESLGVGDGGQILTIPDVSLNSTLDQSLHLICKIRIKFQAVMYLG